MTAFCAMAVADCALPLPTVTSTQCAAEKTRAASSCRTSPRSRTRRKSSMRPVVSALSPDWVIRVAVGQERRRSDSAMPRKADAQSEHWHLSRRARNGHALSIDDDALSQFPACAGRSSMLEWLDDGDAIGDRRCHFGGRECSG